MIFTSYEFLIFLAAVFIIYWLLSRRYQNIFLILAGYVFYGWWDWRFLSLMFASTAIDFVSGLLIGSTEDPRKRKLFLSISIGANIAILGFFKYFNFFIDSLQSLLHAFGVPFSSMDTLSIILPLGISFYTFQSMSYAIDVYRRKLEQTRNFIDYMAFVSFFPQLVAGPIERARHMLPQFQNERHFEWHPAWNGIKRMAWGFFKKIVLADNFGVVVAAIYANHASSGWEYLLATLLFAFQIYFDFSAYSDIAIGTARLFGFTLMENFNYPYFSKSIVQFWQRWHISLTSWFRDYVFIPLGGNRTTKPKYAKNILLVFLTSGLWHGANWTFVVWGFVHGLYLIPYAVLTSREYYRGEKDAVPSLRDLHKIIFTFILVMLAWVFFRASNISESFYILGSIFTNTTIANFPGLSAIQPLWLLALAIVVCIEWLQRSKDHPLNFEGRGRIFRLGVYSAMIIVVLLFGEFSYAPFIYFQF